jgi:queuine tRNA-ribosyltransferase
MKFETIRLDDHSRARTGKLRLGHGVVETPVFMPVGTQATVKSIPPFFLEEAGVQMTVANTYHLHLRPGESVIGNAGGLHAFMGWERNILTDSGGFQVISLADLNRISDEGVQFQSHLDGSRVFFSPEKVIQIQCSLGADIVMSFDEPALFPSTLAACEKTVVRTTDWASKGKVTFEEFRKEHQVLFGIVQGGTHRELRKRSAEELLDISFDGYAIGGLAIGEPKSIQREITDFTAQLLPADRPRYLMGVGYPEDIIDAVAKGIDMFDCVIPTRNARTGTVFTPTGRLVVKNAPCTEDFLPIDEQCECYACRHFSRAYIRHLFNAGEILGPMLATIHNVTFFMKLMREIRASIARNEFDVWSRAFLANYRRT